MAVALRRVLLQWDRKIQSRLSPSLQQKWNHPAGPKTIHFWCPVCKWGLVFAGMSDLARPVEKLSLNQSSSLMVTGFIWTRYCLVIIPKNPFLASCNLFLGLTGLMQFVRVVKHKMDQDDKTPSIPDSE